MDETLSPHVSVVEQEPQDAVKQDALAARQQARADVAHAKEVLGQMGMTDSNGVVLTPQESAQPQAVKPASGAGRVND